MLQAHMAKIPIAELIQDRDASITDAVLCRIAIQHKLDGVRGLDIKNRLLTNEKIISAIDIELRKRGVTNGSH